MYNTRLLHLFQTLNIWAVTNIYIKCNLLIIKQGPICEVFWPSYDHIAEEQCGSHNNIIAGFISLNQFEEHLLCRNKHGIGLILHLLNASNYAVGVVPALIHQLFTVGQTRVLWVGFSERLKQRGKVYTLKFIF